MLVDDCEVNNLLGVLPDHATPEGPGDMEFDEVRDKEERVAAGKRKRASSGSSARELHAGGSTASASAVPGAGRAAPAGDSSTSPSQRTAKTNSDAPRMIFTPAKVRRRGTLVQETNLIEYGGRSDRVLRMRLLRVPRTRRLRVRTTLHLRGLCLAPVCNCRLNWPSFSRGPFKPL